MGIYDRLRTEGVEHIKIEGIYIQSFVKSRNSNADIQGRKPGFILDDW